MGIFEKWNEQIDGKKMAEEVKEVEKNGGEYKEIPVGEYVVKIEKMELKEARNGAPMLAVQFRILDGDFSKSCLFMNQVVTQAFQINIANRFLRSLGTDITVDFDGDYEHYNNTILDVFEECGKLEFLIEYGEKKGYPTFKVKEVYDAA